MDWAGASVSVPVIRLASPTHPCIMGHCLANNKACNVITPSAENKNAQIVMLTYLGCFLEDRDFHFRI